MTATAAPARPTPAVRTRLAPLLLLGGAVLSLAIGLPGTSPEPSSAASLLARATGMLAGYGVAVMLLLMARVPAVERAVGANRITRWHAVSGRAIVVLMLVHAAAATIAWSWAHGIDLPAATLEVLGLPGLAAAVAGAALLCVIGAASARAARRRLRYETWHLLHLGTYVAAGLAFAHQLAGPDVAGRAAVQVFWSLLYTLAYGAVLRYRLLEPVLRALRHRLRVEEVVAHGPDVASIVIGGRHLDELGARPGQFLRWRFLTRSTWHHANPFSLSAAPSATRLRLTVRAVGAGTRAVHAVPPGTRVLAAGPSGGLTADRRSGRGVLLLGAGTGVAPLRALFETLDPTRGPVTLVQRARTAEDLLFAEELRAIGSDRGLEVLLLVGPSTDPDLALTAVNLERWAPDLAHRDVFVCASPGFAASARTALRQAGVPARRIHEEAFAR